MGEPLQRSELSVFTLRRLPIIAGLQIPVFSHCRGELGRTYWWEQRYWISSLRLNAHDFVKYERENHIHSDMRMRYGLTFHDVCRPVPSDGGPLTKLPLLLSSHGLLGWLLTRKTMAYYGQGRRHLQEWIACYTQYGVCAARGAQSVAESGIGMPVIRVDDIPVPVLPTGQVDVIRLVEDRWPQLTGEWQSARDALPWAGLPPFSWRTGILDLLHFVDTRIRASENEIQESHWIWKLRKVLMVTSAWLLEVAVESEAIETSGQVAARPSELYGATGARRSPFQAALRMSLLEQIYQYGSREVICRAIGRAHGTAAQLAAVTIRLYKKNVAAHFADTSSVCVHWDGSTHDGHDVQVGVALMPTDDGTTRAGLLTPVAMYL